MKKSPKGESTHWIEPDGMVVCHEECAEAEQKRLRAKIEEYREENSRLARLVEYEQERNANNVAQADTEIGRLKEQLTQPSLIQEMTIQSLRERLDERDAEIARIETENHNLASNCALASKNRDIVFEENRKLMEFIYEFSCRSRQLTGEEE